MANVQTVTYSPVLVKRVLDDVRTLLEAKQKGSPATVAALTKEVTAELALFGFFADRPKLTLDTLENIQQIIGELEVIYQQIAGQESESNTIDKEKMDDLLADAPADRRNELKTSDSLTHALDQFKEQVKAAEKKILSVEQLRADVVEMIIQQEAAKAPDVDAYNRISAKRPLIEAAVNKAIHKPQENTATFTHTVTRQLEDSKLFTKDGASAVQVMLIEAFEHDDRVQLLQKNNNGTSDFIESVKTGLTTQSDPTIQAAISERLVRSGLDNQTATTVASEIQSQALQAGFSNQLITASNLESTINTIAAAHQINLVTQDLKDISLVTNAFVHAVESHEIVQSYIQPAIVARVNNPQALTALPLTETWLAINHPQFGQPEFKDTELYNTINQSIAAGDLKSFWDYIQQFVASPAEFGNIPTAPYTDYSQSTFQPAQYPDYSPQVGMPGLDNINIPPSLFRSVLSGTPLGMKVDGLLGRFGLPSFFGSTVTGAGGTAAAATTATQSAAIAGVGATTGLSLAAFMGYAALAVLIVVVGIWIFMYFFGGQKLQAIYTIPTASEDYQSVYANLGQFNIDGKMCWPVTGTFFGYMPENHASISKIPNASAIDIDASVGSQVITPFEGIVEAAVSGWNGGYGNLVIIGSTINDASGNPRNCHFYYGHLSVIGVTQRQPVTPGTIIGRVGSTGNSTGPHVHWEVRCDGMQANIRDFIPEPDRNVQFGGSTSAWCYDEDNNPSNPE